MNKLDNMLSALACGYAFISMHGDVIEELEEMDRGVFEAMICMFIDRFADVNDEDCIDIAESIATDMKMVNGGKNE